MTTAPFAFRDPTAGAGQMILTPAAGSRYPRLGKPLDEYQEET